MPKYYIKDKDNKYVEKTYRSIADPLFQKTDFGTFKFTNISKLEMTHETMRSVIASLEDQLYKILVTQKPVRPKMFDMPQEPSRYYWVEESYGPMGSHDPNEFTTSSVQKEYTDEEYDQKMKQFTTEKQAWLEYTKSLESQYSDDLRRYNERDDVKKLPELSLLLKKLKDIDSSTLRELNNCIKIPTSDELFASFKESFSQHKSKWQQLKELQHQFIEINKDEKLNSDQKVQKFLEQILINYRKVIRSAKGAPTIFSQGSSLAKDLRDFCKQKLGIALPETLAKGQPLAMNLPPINGAPICQYLLDQENFRVQFTPSPTAPGQPK